MQLFYAVLLLLQINFSTEIKLDEPDSCVICTEEHAMYQTPCCKKNFHPKCINKWICESNGTCPNCRTLIPNEFAHLNTSLWFAANNDNVAQGSEDIAQGAYVNSVQLKSIGMNPFTYTPLHEAAEMGNEHFVNFLLLNGADVNRQDGWRRMTPLHFAAMHGTKFMVANLIEKGAELDSVNFMGDSPLHYAAANHEEPAILRVLLANGAAVEIENAYGRTALRDAIWQRLEANVRILLEYGADVNHVDKAEAGGNTPLHYAAQTDNGTIFKMLLEKGANGMVRNEFDNFENKRKTAIETAMEKNGECKKILVEMYDQIYANFGVEIFDKNLKD